MSTVALDRVSATYGANRVLTEVSVEAAHGELLALLGPSGSGKTTALKAIAGLLEPEAGVVRIDGQSMAGVPAEKRSAAMVFQKPLLFPYMNVRENVAFGLKMRKVSAAETDARVRRAIELVQLTGFEKRRPSELSGGQEQRVALARALVIEPKVLLLDEPFSALDEGLRAEMARLVLILQKLLNITTVFVTHNQEEAAGLADRIGLLLEGRLVQVGAPREFYTKPASLEVARFFGWQTVVRGERLLAFRPERARVAATGDGVDVTVERVLDLGTSVRYAVKTERGELIEIEQESAPVVAGGKGVLVIDAEWAVEFGRG